MKTKEELIAERDRINEQIKEMAIGAPLPWQRRVMECIGGEIEPTHVNALRIDGRLQWCAPGLSFDVEVSQDRRGLAVLDVLREVLADRLDGMDI